MHHRRKLIFSGVYIYCTVSSLGLVLSAASVQPLPMARRDCVLHIVCSQDESRDISLMCMLPITGILRN